MQHLRVVYRGQVQGVGFRWSVKALADSLSLAGSVQNEPDGSVLLVVHGEPDRISSLMEGIDAKFVGYITGKRIQETDILPIDPSFEIRR